MQSFFNFVEQLFRAHEEQVIELEILRFCSLSRLVICVRSKNILTSCLHIHVTRLRIHVKDNDSVLS